MAQVCKIDFCRSSDRDVARSILTDSFQDDPLFAWLCPDDMTRPMLLDAWMSLAIMRARTRGHSYVARVGGQVQGVALWAPPEIPIITPAEREVQVEVARSIAGADVEERLDRLSPVVSLRPASGYFYLRDIAVRESARRQGVGRCLLEYVHKLCDELEVGAYLETTQPATRLYFERYGYAAIGEHAVEESVTLTGMLRHPRE